jgi:hypothetical protein
VNSYRFPWLLHWERTQATVRVGIVTLLMPTRAEVWKCWEPHIRTAPLSLKKRAQKGVYFCTPELLVLHHQFPCQHTPGRHS